MSILDNHHIVLCLGAAIFDYFGVTFFIRKNDLGEIKNVFISNLNDNRVTNAVQHVKLLMITCKRVRAILLNAFKNKESYFPVYHFRVLMANILSIFNNTAAKYIKQDLMEYSILHDYPPNVKLMLDYMYARFTVVHEQNVIHLYLCINNENDDRVLPSSMPTEYKITSITLPWQTMILALDMSETKVFKKLREIRKIRDSFVRRIYHQIVDYDEQIRLLKKRKHIDHALKSWAMKQ